MIGKEEGDKLVAERILCECRRIKGPVLIHKGGHRAQRYILIGLPAEATIIKTWRILERATSD